MGPGNRLGVAIDQPCPRCCCRAVPVRSRAFHMGELAQRGDADVTIVADIVTARPERTVDLFPDIVIFRNVEPDRDEVVDGVTDPPVRGILGVDSDRLLSLPFPDDLLPVCHCPAARGLCDVGCQRKGTRAHLSKYPKNKTANHRDASSCGSY